jgi:hypothetical protein
MTIKETEKLQILGSQEHKSKIKSEWKTIGIRVRNEELPLLNKQLDRLNYVTMGDLVKDLTNPHTETILAFCLVVLRASPHFCFTFSGMRDAGYMYDPRCRLDRGQGERFGCRHLFVRPGTCRLCVFCRTDVPGLVRCARTYNKN